MFEWLLSSLAAFLLFVVGLPLFGLLVAFFFRICLPYLAGPALAFSVIYYFGFATAFWGAATLSVAWVVSICHVRKRLRQLRPDLCWCEGHYYGVANVLTFATLLRKRLVFADGRIRSAA